MHLTLYNLAAVLTVAAVVACVAFGLRPWLMLVGVRGWHPGRIARAARRAEAQGLPVCGHCGHPVALWSQAVRVPPNCGECGALYSACGIVSRATIARVSPSTAVIAALLLPPAGIVGWLAYGGTYELLTPTTAYSAQISAQPRPSIIRRTSDFALAPSRVEGRSKFDTTRYSDFDDPPPYELRFDIDVLGTGAPGGVSSSAITPTDGRIQIRVRGEAVPMLHLDFRPADGSWTLAGGPASSVPLRGTGAEQAMAALFTRAGLDARPWAAAERAEAVERLQTASMSGTINGFVASGHPSEAAHAHDTAMTRISIVGSGEGSSWMPHGTTPLTSQPLMPSASPPPVYAHPLAILAGLIPAGIGVAMVVVYGLTRGRLLLEAAPNARLADGPPPLPGASGPPPRD
ncbi:MAG: hypothetical protein AAFV77_02115 [Planctomycetota bacterium]